jgi:L-iditol 2-dehydrogenase
VWAYRVTAPGQLTEVEVPAPTSADVGEGDVVVRILAGGICGSDLPKFAGVKNLDVDADGRFLPGAIGAPMHEIVGVVETARCEDVAVGDRVVGWASRSNGLAERVVTQGDRVFTYRCALEPSHAVVAQSLACVIEALGRVEVEDRDVTVVGLGPIGLLFAHVARSRGARTVTGVDPVDRSDVGRTFGLDAGVVSTSGAWAAAAENQAPDVVIEAVGHQSATLDHAIRAAAIGATVLCFGIPDQDLYPVNVERIMRNNLTLVGGITRHHRRALAAADGYLVEHRGLAAELVTDRLPRTDVQRAFETAARPAPGRLKVVLDLG